MPVRIGETVERPSYAGLRMSAEEYFALPEDDRRFELIDGLVVMLPSPMASHQLIVGEVLFQLGGFNREQRPGIVLPSVDVQLNPGKLGRPIVYRPDIIFVRAENATKIKGRVNVTPNVVVEVVAPDYRAYDEVTKRGDYELAGVAEYWIVDPELQTFRFLRLRGDRYEEAPAVGDYFESAAVPGFKLDLSKIRENFGKL